MMEYVLNLKLFYPMLFTTIVILTIAVCSTIKYMNGNTTHKGIVENIKDIFFKSSDNAKEVTIDTTSKMKSMHDNVIPLKYTSVQEKELHTIEVGLKNLKDNVDEINAKVDELIKRVIILEEHK